jgi:hypothetical protein
MRQNSSRSRMVLPCSPKEVAQTLGNGLKNRLDTAFRQRISFVKGKR